MNPADLSVAQASRAMRTKSLSARELVTAHLDRIDHRNGALDAFVYVDRDGALAAALAADEAITRGGPMGPLHGIPVALKDLIDTAGMPTQYGSKLFAGHQPKSDAECVTLLTGAGAIIVGKVASYEFATVGPSFDTPFPPARNPWSKDHITGGSSSGSAAAVAGGLVRIAIGTDTGGSVRSPSSYCGIAGFKPAAGRVSKSGVFPLSPSLDCVGPLAANARDAAIAYSVLAGQPLAKLLQDQPRERLDGITIGYARAWFANDPLIGSGVLDALDTAASTLSLLGAHIREIDLPDYERFEAAAAAILHAEAFDIHKSWLATRASEYGRKTFRTLAAGAALNTDDMTLARRAGEALAQALNEVFDTIDVILTANTLSTAPALSEFEGDAAVWTPMRTIAFNLTGHPALAVPCGFIDGLPLGLQLLGMPGAEAGLFAIAEAYEMATDHAAVRPILPSGDVLATR